MSTSKTGTTGSTALHERYLIETAGAGRPEAGLRDELDFLRREGMLLPDEEFLRRREAGEAVDLARFRSLPRAGDSPPRPRPYSGRSSSGA